MIGKIFLVIGILALIIIAAPLYDVTQNDKCTQTGYIYSSFYGYKEKCVYNEFEARRDKHPSYPVYKP